MELSVQGPNKKSFVRIQPRKGLLNLDLRDIWRYRELLYFLTWRDVIVRYKQTAIGVVWAILQPVITMVVFAFLFNKIAQIPSDGIPYPIFTFTALLPWMFFSQALTKSTSSVVGSQNLITKIYFPRLLIPLSASFSPMFDLLFSFMTLLVLMFWYQITPTWGLLALPLFVGLAFLTALAVGLWTSALNVQYRDVGHVIPFMSQIWMYVSPVAYPVSMVPENWKLLYSLNPMVGVIEGFRWSLLGKERPEFIVILVSTMIVLILLLGGIIYFKKMEKSFADII